MAGYRNIACLAASTKNHAWCYAGRDIATGEWVRPVSSDAGHGISNYYRVVGKGDPAVVGDILQMRLGDPIPSGYQTENVEHIKEHWRRLGKFNFEQACSLVDQPQSIWGTSRSTKYGVNDELSEAEAMACDHSLLLVRVSDLKLNCRDEGFDTVKIRVRAEFHYNGIPYGLRVTDPEAFVEAPGLYDLGDALICCSLAELFTKAGRQYAYKLAAAIITPARLG